MARLAVVVDLPSPGPALETTKMRGPASRFRNWRFVRRLRKDSARGLRGSACTISGRLVASGSYAMPPSTGRSVRASMSWSVWMRLSSTVRSMATATPRASPMMPPRMTSSRTFGLVGAVGTSAGSVTVMRTGLTASSTAGCSSVFCTAS